MSIETDLNRIATCMEEILKTVKGNSGQTIGPAAPVTSAAPKAGKAAGNANSALGRPVAAAAQAPSNTAITEDPITGQPIPAGGNTAQPTLDEVHIQLRLLKDSPKGGIEACKKIMIEFGAEKTRPVISSIPPANYQALITKIGTLL